MGNPVGTSTGGLVPAYAQLSPFAVDEDAEDAEDAEDDDDDEVDDDDDVVDGVDVFDEDAGVADVAGARRSAPCAVPLRAACPVSGPAPCLS
ncbi:hypothetical protein [Streptomyces sp. NPDC101393]|uniref:hypothetical protein n=1 Tax=Streptomyces sp. NPDC101393 TaxID=3366141 RepID=UPI0037F2C310